MDGGTDGLEQSFLQIKKNDQELDQELEMVHQGVKRLGVMATEMNTELKIQRAMIDETKQKAEDVNEHLLQVPISPKWLHSAPKRRKHSRPGGRPSSTCLRRSPFPQSLR